MERIKLVASAGMVLTDGENFGRVVYPSHDDSPDNWYEITEEEADKRMNGEEATDEDYQSALREMGVNI